MEGGYDHTVVAVSQRTLHHCSVAVSSFPAATLGTMEQKNTPPSGPKIRIVKQRKESDHPALEAEDRRFSNIACHKAAPSPHQHSVRETRHLACPLARLGQGMEMTGQKHFWGVWAKNPGKQLCPWSCARRRLDRTGASSISGERISFIRNFSHLY